MRTARVLALLPVAVFLDLLAAARVLCHMCYECWLRISYALSRDTPKGRARKHRVERHVCDTTPP